MNKYPEHKKLIDLDGENQVVGDFLTWLNSKGYTIAEWRPADGGWSPVPASTTNWIAAYFGIDENRLEDEKCAMLDEMLEDIMSARRA